MKELKMLTPLHRNAIMVSMAACAMPSFAQGFLTAAEVRALVVGNTVEVQRPNGNRYLAHFEPSGVWLRQEAGRVSEGKWRILEDGMQCVAIGKDDACAQIQKNADGTYTRIQDGKAVFQWIKVSSGKGF